MREAKIDTMAVRSTTSNISDASGPIARVSLHVVQHAGNPLNEKFTAFDNHTGQGAVDLLAHAFAFGTADWKEWLLGCLVFGRQLLWSIPVVNIPLRRRACALMTDDGLVACLARAVYCIKGFITATVFFSTIGRLGLPRGWDQRLNRRWEGGETQPMITRESILSIGSALGVWEVLHRA